LTGSTRRACPADELEPPTGKVDLIYRDLDEVMHWTAAASHLVPVKRRR